jgi:hypothetical protein
LPIVVGVLPIVNGVLLIVNGVLPIVGGVLPIVGGVLPIVSPPSACHWDAACDWSAWGQLHALWRWLFEYCPYYQKVVCPPMCDVRYLHLQREKKSALSASASAPRTTPAASTAKQIA